MADAESVRNDRSGMKVLTIPSFEHWLEIKSPHYPYTKSYEEAKFDPICVLHSSGTTGFPKPIVWYNASLNRRDSFQILSHETSNGQVLVSDRVKGSRLLSPLPPYWSMGICLLVLFPVFTDVIIVMLPTDTPLSLGVELFDRIHAKVDLDGGCYLPTHLKALSLDATAFSRMTQKLKFITYGGAPLEPWVGDLFSEAGVDVLPFVGAGETGFLLNCQPSAREDWRYYQFHPEAGCRMQRVSNSENLYELVIDRKPQCELYQAIFVREQDLESYCTQDLYSPHPDKPDLWLYQGRKDDLFKLSFLAKFHATDIEINAERHPKVHAALVGGEGRDEPFVVLELENKTIPLSVNEEEVIMKEVLEVANGKGAQEFGLRKEMILITQEPLGKTFKGTINRKAALTAFESEIENLYRRT